MQRVQPLHGFADGGRVLGRGERGAGLGLNHQRVASEGLFGQVLFHQFGRFGRTGSGQGQVVVGLALAGLPGDDEGDGDHDPDRDRRPVVPRAEATDRVEGRRHAGIIPFYRRAGRPHSSGPAGFSPFSNAFGTEAARPAPRSLAQEGYVLGVAGGERGGEGAGRGGIQLGDESDRFRERGVFLFVGERQRFGLLFGPGSSSSLASASVSPPRPRIALVSASTWAWSCPRSCWPTASVGPVQERQAALVGRRSRSAPGRASC